MKRILAFTALCLSYVEATAQQVPRAVLAEHFTNTYCSICASRNPGLFSNMGNFSQVIHVAYYPSAPYAACPLSMHNKPEADARANYYGAYGGTPRLFVGGSQVTGVFTDPAVFSSQLALTSSFALNTTISKKGTDSVMVSVTIRKADTSSLSAMQLFTAIVEDTLLFAAANGEGTHYDVFRKAPWGTTALSITAPSGVGDSAVYTKTVALHSAWAQGRLRAVAVLNRPDKIVVQAAKSDRLDVPAKSGSVHMPAPLVVYPNPVSGELFIGVQTAATTVQIRNIAGVQVMYIGGHCGSSLDVSNLAPGNYVLILNDGLQQRSASFVRK